MTLVLKPYPVSHLQLIVPVQYAAGGTVASATLGKYEGFDGDPDTYMTTVGTLTDEGIDFPAEIKLPSWVLIHGQYGNTGTSTHRYYFTSLNEYAYYFATTAYAEEDVGATSKQWTVGISTSGYARRATGKGIIRSSVLVQISSNDPEAYTTCFDVRLKPYLLDAGCNVRNCAFSNDFNVPPYDKTWSAGYEFADMGVNPNPAGFRHVDFALADEARLTAKHHFEWSGLTFAEMEVFWAFFAAFGGVLTRPFWMCIMNGDPPAWAKAISLNLMTLMELVIDPATVNYGCAQDGDYKVSFDAHELLPA